MKTISFYSFFLLCAVLNSYSQSSGYLEVNNIRAGIKTTGSFFSGIDTSQRSFEAPINSGKNTIWGTNILMGGMDSNGGLRLNRGVGSYADDFISGPFINGMDSAYVIQNSMQYNRIYRVTRNEIMDYQANFGNSWYVIPPNILDWPGSFSYNSVNYTLAPFHDANSDSIYDPGSGDYPIIKGDEAIFLVKNDQAPHYLINEPGFGCEYRFMFYAFSDPSDSALFNTVFMEVSFVNRTTETFYGTNFGIWTDLDIGFAEDDFVGCDVADGYYYGINGDSLDDNYMGYGSFPPVQAVVLLGGPQMDADGYDNIVDTVALNWNSNSSIPYPNIGTGFEDGIVDNERLGLTRFQYYIRGDMTPDIAMGEPFYSDEIMNYMTGNWMDSSYLYFGGNGFELSQGAIDNGLVNCKYAFPGASDPFNYGTNGIAPAVSSTWTEFNIDCYPSDQRALGSCGPFTFGPGEVNTVEVAYVFAQNDLVSYPDGILDFLDQYVEDVRQMWRNDSTGMYPNSFTVGLAKSEIADPINLSFSLFPNPAISEINIVSEKEIMSKVEILDVLGNVVFSEKVNNQNFKYTIAGYSTGIYFVRVHFRNGFYATRQFVVSK